MRQETLTLSGVADKFLYRSNKSEVVFLFGFKNLYLYQTIQKNVGGGPIIVFSRYKNVNETVINDANVKSIVSYNAYALYLTAIGGNMLRGPLTQFVRNQQQNCLVADEQNLQHGERHYIAFMTKQHHQKNPSCYVSTRFTKEHHQVGTFILDAICVQCEIV